MTKCLVYGWSIAGIKKAFLIALGTALLTSPWWLTVIVQHGLAPFHSAIQTGVRETLWASLFHSIFSMQGGLPLLPILFLAGVWVCLRRREILLPVWAIFPFFLDPRNAPAMAIYPLVMLSVEGLYFLKEEFDRAYARTLQRDNKTAHATPIPQWILAGLLLYLIYVSSSSAQDLVRLSLTPADRVTMEWVKANTPADSRFLLITAQGQFSPMTDSFQEWFPTLTERRNQNTLQGKEWTLGPRFYAYTQELVALQACSRAGCLHEWLARNDLEFDYLLFQRKRTSNEFLLSVKNEEQYRVVYETSDVVIFTIK